MHQKADVIQFECRQPDGSFVDIDMTQVADGDVVRLRHPDGTYKESTTGQTLFKVKGEPLINGDWIDA